jgi:hypothetical protein
MIPKLKGGSPIRPAPDGQKANNDHQHNSFLAVFNEGFEAPGGFLF